MKRKVVLYVGWAGRGNMGDEAIYEAWQDRLPSIEFVPAPLYRSELVSGLSARLRAGGLRLPVVLGGGTTLGIASWRRHLRLARALSLGGDVHVLGAGGVNVEAPLMAGGQQVDLDGWSTMTHVKYWGVRDPHAAELLRTWGISSPVCGDPALLLPGLRGVAPGGHSDRIGVSIGLDAGQAFPPQVLAEALRRLVAEITPGKPPLLLLASEADLAPSLALKEHLGDAELVHAATPDEAMKWLSRCAVVAGQRLHTTILAAALGVPVVGLAYQSKIAAAFESFGVADLALAPDAHHDEVVAAAKRAMSSDYRAVVARSVASYVQLLDTAFDRLEGTLAQRQRS